LERQAIEGLARTGRTLVCAESCTGGLLAARLTGVPGASAVILGGIVAYANAVKRDLLEVPETLLAAEGAVSAACAAAMAVGARRRLGSDWALATTGIAGPGGATPAKPVGLVFLAAAGPEDVTLVERYLFAGGREEIRRQSVEQALRLLLAALGRTQ
jgi:PncC family amidohydrolase